MTKPQLHGRKAYDNRQVQARVQVQQRRLPLNKPADPDDGIIIVSSRHYKHKH